MLRVYLHSIDTGLDSNPRIVHVASDVGENLQPSSVVNCVRIGNWIK